MKEAGKCEAYASDLLIDLYPILKWLYGDANFDTIANRTFMFGFRNFGVDHDKFIKARLEQGYEYRAFIPYASSVRISMTWTGSMSGSKRLCKQLSLMEGDRGVVHSVLRHLHFHT